MSEYEDEDSRTIFIANLSNKVTESLLCELFIQAGPLEKVAQPKDKDGRARAFAFITYIHAISVPYAVNVFQGTELFNRVLTIRPRNSNNFHSITQQNPLDANPRLVNGSSRFDRNRDQNPKIASRFSKQASLGSGFNPIPTTTSMQTQVRRCINQQQSNGMGRDVNKFVPMMGSKVLQLNMPPSNLQESNGRQSNGRTRPAVDMVLADIDRSVVHSSNLKNFRREQMNCRLPPQFSFSQQNFCQFSSRRGHR